MYASRSRAVIFIVVYASYRTLNMSSSYSTQSFICRLCHGVLEDPQQTTCCGCHFCLKCIIGKLSADNSACPECNKEEIKYFQDIHFGRVVKNSTRIQRNFADVRVEKDNGADLNQPYEDGVIDCGKIQNHMHRRCSSQPTDGSTPLLSNTKEASDRLLKVFSDKVDAMSSTYEMKCAKLEKRQEKIEEIMEIHKKVLQTLCSKIEALQNQITSHALLPYGVTVPSIDSYFDDGRQGDEWNSPGFYTGTLTSKGYKLQLSIVPYSLYMHNKQKALSARLLIAKGEDDDRLTWPFQATYKLVFNDPSDTEKPYIVVGQHTWESPRDESSMHFHACITHKDLLKYVKYDNCLHVCIQD